MIRAVLPGMRARRKGHILNITSVAGFCGFAGSGYYAASKHAVEGLSNSLAREVAPLGIRVTCIEPGPFRTDWAGRSLKQTPSRIVDYADTVAARMKATSDVSGKQAGDPVRAGDAMIRLVESPDPPRHLVRSARTSTGTDAGWQRASRRRWTPWSTGSLRVPSGRNADGSRRKGVRRVFGVLGASPSPPG